ncbi:phospholipid-binding domain protein [Pseudomonas sp. StFLB209]|uniref:BON domain-containing protein n=1 Tax=Pseudomonas sp. StFLB209 TaxID=1028989 RepID=UPI0004F7695A|nr:BON domain-containing protein [Pseudomonas sp. StFLB209]BAP43461.1 phospholipid-binding domain protein [Pseudomonas sp. StFLB209]
MKKFAIAAAAAALTLSMTGGAFAQTTTQAPLMLAANTTVENAKQEGSDTWITTKVKADLLTEKGIPGSDIKVETANGVVALSSDVKVTETQKKTAVNIAKNIKGVKSVTAEALKAE